MTCAIACGGQARLIAAKNLSCGEKKMSEPQAERNDKTVEGRGVRLFDWERGDFRRGHSSHNDKVGRAPHWTG
jgi:hypothetical protein